MQICKIINSGFISALVVDLLLSCSVVNSMRLPVSAGSDDFSKMETMLRAPLVKYTFVDTALKGLSGLVYGKLVDSNGTGLEALEEEGKIDLFFRGNSKVEANFAGAVVQMNNRLVIAFPGTRLKHSVGTAKSDVIADVSVIGEDGGFAENLSQCDVHPGFAKEVMEFWPNLESCIRGHSGYEEIFFTGHSKGAAMALITAFKFAHEHQQTVKSHPNFVKVFAFSSPAVFSEKARNLFHDYVDGRNIICIYKNNDVVPVSSMPFKFVHAGIQANISLNQSSVEDATEGVKFLIETLAVSLAKQSVDVKALTKWAVSTVLESHCLDGFTPSQVREVMERIKGNYWKNPSMDLNAMGRDSSGFCNVM